MRRLTEEDCRACMRDGDFPEGVRAAASFVAIILTQSWCPQWTRMRSYLEPLRFPPDAELFYVEYDREEFFAEFMAFKETVLGNSQVPYLRYYHAGALVSEGNYSGRAEFLSRLGVEPAGGPDGP